MYLRRCSTPKSKSRICPPSQRSLSTSTSSHRSIDAVRRGLPTYPYQKMARMSTQITYRTYHPLPSLIEVEVMCIMQMQCLFSTTTPTKPNHKHSSSNRSNRHHHSSSPTAVKGSRDINVPHHEIIEIIVATPFSRDRCHVNRRRRKPC